MMANRSETEVLGVSSPRFCRFVMRGLDELNRYTQTLGAEFTFPDGSGVELNIVQRNSVNASAAWRASDRTYAITFNLGLMVWAYEIAATSAAIYENDFTCSEAQPISLHLFQTRNHETFLQDTITRADERLDGRQDGYAESIFGVIILTIFAHELSHIVRGHLDHLMRNGSAEAQVLDELMMKDRDSAEHAGHIRAYEYDADRFGSALLAELAFDPPPAFERWGLNTPAQNLAVVLFSFALFTSALYDAQKASGCVSTRYPSPLLRFSIAVSQIRRAWMTRETTHRFETEILEKSMLMLSLFEDAYPIIDHFREFSDNETVALLERESDEVIDDYESIEDSLAVRRFEPRRDDIS